MKELAKTPFIEALLAKVVGKDADLSKLHVYEVSATNTIALRGKSGTIFEKAKISPHTISQLAQAVNNDPIPLMMDHNLAGAPYGKFFYAESIPSDTGEIELRGLLYVDDSEEKILSKLEAASIEEVSIQFLSQNMICSECDFDYMAAAAEDNFEPFWDLTCGNGHKIGKDGVHVRLVGVNEVVELSLVSRGAVKNSKIISSSDAMLGESARRLAASGIDVFNNYYCTTSVDDEDNNQGVNEVTIDDKFLTKLTTLAEEKSNLTVSLAAETAKTSALSSQVTDLETKLADLQTQVDALTTELADAKNTESIPEETISKMSAYVGKAYVALKTLEGDAEAVVPQDISEVVDFVSENHTKLSALIPVDGVSSPAGTQDQSKTEVEKRSQIASLSAYKAN